ncbi:MAG: DUF4142 domain-containing protein [Janthinobacterium lividum]
MKTLFLNGLWAAMLLAGTAACNSSPDSVKDAQAVNEKKIEAGTPDSTAAGSNLKDAREYDTKFMTKAASGGMLEVQLGQAVAKSAVSPQAKAIASQMVTDHTKANDELKALATKLNVTLPTTLGNDAQSVYKDVTAQKGTALDKEYVSKMESDHKEDIKDYEEASTKAASPELRAFAAKTLPTLRGHLSMIEQDKPTIAALK